MLQYKKEICNILGIKSEPNTHEVYLFNRGQKYIKKLTKIPGIEMIAICNSLSMYATHRDSDIDLFIITKPGMIWFVRFFTTITLWIHGVWRKNQDIRENFCLSFFVTTDAMDLQTIAIKDDIYLYYWLYHMKPIYIKNNTYVKFLEANKWVEIDETQKGENQKYIINHKPQHASSLCKFCISVDEIFVKIAMYLNFAILENKSNTDIKMKHGRFGRLLLLLVTKVREIYLKKEDIHIRGFGKGSLQDDKKIYEDSEINSEGQKHIKIYKKLNQIIRFFLLPRTTQSKLKLGNPEGIIISDNMLKFHDKDRRKEISGLIFKKNFDK